MVRESNLDLRTILLLMIQDTLLLSQKGITSLYRYNLQLYLIWIHVTILFYKTCVVLFVTDILSYLR